MLKLIANRLLQMVLIMAVVSGLLFFIFDSDKFKKQIAVAELGGFAVTALSDQDYEAWLEKKGLNVPFYERYAICVGGILRGDLGKSYQTNEPVLTLVFNRLAKTGILGFWVFALMIPLSLTCGVVAGMKEGSAQDRITSFISIVTTSLPEIATAVILMSVFALWLKWVPSNSAMVAGWDWRALILPVMTLVLYEFG
jgi:peptide/nickel transport system permease protein